MSPLIDHDFKTNFTNVCLFAIVFKKKAGGLWEKEKGKGDYSIKKIQKF